MLEASERGIIWKLTEISCPSCDGKNIARILWGYPDMKVIEEKLEQKEIILGGCIVTDHDPKWECNDCHHRWGERED